MLLSRRKNEPFRSVTSLADNSGFALGSNSRATEMSIQAILVLSVSVSHTSGVCVCVEAAMVTLLARASTRAEMHGSQD